MTRQIWIVGACFAAALLGGMMGTDLRTPEQDYLASGHYEVARTAAADAAPSGGGGKTASPVVAAVKRVGPAVVNIDTVVMRRTSLFGFSDPFADFFGSDPFTRLVPSKGQGSGFIIDGDKGYVLTNDHVVHDAIVRKGKIKVSLPNKQTYEATPVGFDPQYDIAVLKIDGKGLPSVKLGSSDDLTIGEAALAIGNPFGFRNTVTVGVVSAVDRSLQSEDGANLQGLIQTDAAINPGNSGGPLCDIEGNVIGINTAIISGAEGLGFAIGASSIKGVVEELIRYGRIKHGWTGMTFWDISERLANRLGLANTNGALVAEVYRNSPADDAGIKPGDAILKADGKNITSVADLQGVLRETRAGDQLSLTLSRRGKQINVKINLTEAPSGQDR